MPTAAPTDPARTRRERNAAGRARRQRNARVSKLAGVLVAVLVAGLQAWNMTGGWSPGSCPPAAPAVTVTATVIVKSRPRHPHTTAAPLPPAPVPTPMRRDRP